MNIGRRLRDLPGVLLLDVQRYTRALGSSGIEARSDPQGWISLCNRIETIRENPSGPGVECEWQWGSRLHAPEVLPFLGTKLMATALREWPIEFMDEPRHISETPEISFVFAHSGVERLTQLVRTIRSVFAQCDVTCECIVVDQSPVTVQAQLPAHVVYRHLTKDGVSPGWHKSWAYNVGARLARGEIVVFHDGDVCAPRDYAAEVRRVIGGGEFDVVSLQRLLFYLTPRATREADEEDRIVIRETPSMSFQNWKGGTIAIRRDAFLSLGGFDEGFVDWGGEDDEFYDRCSTLRHCRFGYVPFVHLWHPPQPDRKTTDNPNITRVMPWRLGIPRELRVRELGQRRFGEFVAPDPAVGYKHRSGPWD